MTKPFNIITDQDKLDAAIKSVGTRGAKLDRDIWQAAVSALVHAEEHGNPSRINALVAAMPKGGRVNALREFITAFGKVSYDEANRVFVHDKAGALDVEGAMAASWTSFKPEPEYKPFDASKAIAAMLKRVKTADKDKGDKVSPAQAKAIYALAAACGVEA